MMPGQLMKLPQPAVWKARMPGLAVSAIVAAAAQFLAGHYGAPLMLLALLLGMAVNFLSKQGACKEGIEFAARHVLRWGVALLGLRISWAQVEALGWQSVVAVVGAVCATIGFGLIMARLMGFRQFFGLLSGGAVGICGASAALALSASFPSSPASERATLFVVIGVSSLSTMAMVFYPMVVKTLGLDPVSAGIFLGGTIHDVAQVVGAGYSIGQQTGDAATVVKLIRVAMLVPVILFAGWMARGLDPKTLPPSDDAKPANAQRPPLLPGFAVGFALLVFLNSLGWIPAAASAAGTQLSAIFLVVAISALGMKTHLQEIVSVGWKPVALMVLETLFLALLVLGLIWLGGSH